MTEVKWLGSGEDAELGTLEGTGALGQSAPTSSCLHPGINNLNTVDVNTYVKNWIRYLPADRKPLLDLWGHAWLTVTIAQLHDPLAGTYKSAVAEVRDPDTGELIQQRLFPPRPITTGGNHFNNDSTNILCWAQNQVLAHRRRKTCPSGQTKDYSGKCVFPRINPYGTSPPPLRAAPPRGSPTVFNNPVCPPGQYWDQRVNRCMPYVY